MALVSEELASDATLDKVLCICSGRRPIKPYTEGLANKGPSCSMVTAKSGVNLSQELPPLFLGDTSLKNSGSAFLIMAVIAPWTVPFLAYLNKKELPED